ncbi:hypothetical protein PO124_18515 [Bacillus licheniformis]|nr:hypothetical protein [Bacillus licheniformis]
MHLMRSVKRSSPKRFICQRFAEDEKCKVMRRLIRAAYMNEPAGDLSTLENRETYDEIAGLSVRKICSILDKAYKQRRRTRPSSFI